jgi:hypothetical protein
VAGFVLAPSGLSPVATLFFFVKANQTLRANAAQVNSIFLVQLRKILCPGFHSVRSIKVRLKDPPLLRVVTTVSMKAETPQKNLVDRLPGLSTRRAQEMQITAVPWPLLNVRANCSDA